MDTVPKVALYFGDSLSPNLVRFLGGLDKVVTSNIRMEIVGNKLNGESIPDRYSYYELDRRRSNGKIDLMRFAYSDVLSYANSQDRSPDVIWQTTNPAFHAIPVTIASKRAGVPVMTRFPGSCFSEYLYMDQLANKMGAFVLYNIQLRLMEYSDYIIVLSKKNKKELEGRNISKDKIHILKQPLDTETFSPPDKGEREEIRTELDFEPSSVCVLYIGRLSKMKGMDILFETVQEFENDQEYEFHLVGEGEYGNQLSSCENVVVHGYVEPNNIHKYHKASDILVHPSRVDEEGISWTMLEAAATRLPVAALNRENANDVASFTFSNSSELAEYLSDTAKWKPATYPTSWSVNYLRSNYSDFFKMLFDRFGR